MKVGQYTIMKNKGFTLVELIVAFAIFSMLMATVAGLLPGFIKQYNYVQNSVQADKIGTTLLDLIESELSYARSIELIDGGTESDTVKYVNNNLVTIYLGVYDGNDALGVEGADGSSLGPNTFAFVYPPYKYLDSDNNETTDCIVWGYTEKYYVKNIVENFKVTEMDESYRPNVYKVEFDLTRSDTNQTKHFERLFQCINQK